MLLYLSVVIIWWLNFTIRLLNHARDEQFWKMPWRYLWISTYLLGWIFLLSHHTIVSFIDLTVLVNPSFPIMQFIHTTVVFLYIAISLYVINDTSSYNFRLSFIGIIIIYALGISLQLNTTSYQSLGWQLDVLNYSLLIIGSINGATVYWKQYRLPTNSIEIAHALWYLLFVTFLGIGYLIFSINALLGLTEFFGGFKPELQRIAYTLVAWSIIFLMIMVQPDDVLIHTIYPLRQWQYQRLKKLKRYILSHLNEKRQPLAFQDEHLNLDGRIYETMVTILDYYLFLEEEDIYRHQLTNIEAQRLPSDDMTWALFFLTYQVSARTSSTQ
ncbi:MAG: hypothetical protein AAFV93_11090 [Chloroflexota bacterium]